jgi:hypothetical protein
MAKFTSKFAKLGFYVDGTRKNFFNGVYHTDDKKEIEILEKMDFVEKEVEEKVEEKAEETVEKKPATSRKKPSAKQ